MSHSVAVRGLIVSGGYATLSIVSVGASGGSLRLSGSFRHESYAELVPIGTYRLLCPADLTCDVRKDATAVVARLEENSRVRVVETRVEDGCVRGRVVEVVLAEGNARRSDKKDVPGAMTGWVSLFEPPSFSAEHISEE
jgi:hypothetical protein